MASCPPDVHTLNMASSPSDVRTLIVDGFPPQEELSKLYLYVQFLLDEDQIADFIGMTDDSHAIILHGSSYLSTAMELIDGDIYQGCTLSCRPATPEEQSLLFGYKPKTKEPAANDTQLDIDQLISLLKSLPSVEKQMVLEALQPKAPLDALPSPVVQKPSDNTYVTEFNAANPNPLTSAAPVLSTTLTTPSCVTSMHPVMTEVPSYNVGYPSLPAIPPVIPDSSPKTNMNNGDSSKLTMPYQMPSYQQLPRLPLFHGEHHKGENSYQHWKYEVNSLLQDRIYPEPFIMQAIRRSLRGEAADVLRHVGPKASIASILEKMDLVFGNILPSNLIFERFCTAEQKASESVAEWGCRLEDIIAQLEEKDQLNPENRKSLLRSRFFYGLKSADIKNRLNHHFDNGASFEILLKAARACELELNPGNKTPKVKVSAVQQSMNSDGDIKTTLNKILEGINNLKVRVDSLEDNKKLNQQKNSYRTVAANEKISSGLSQLPRPSIKPKSNLRSLQWRNHQHQYASFKGQCFKCGQQGHHQKNCPLN